MPWLLVHLTATAVLAGVGWVVQVVVYPAFALVGVAEWDTYHRRHQRAGTLVVGPPWLVQGTSVGVLGFTAPDVGVAALAVLAVAGVLLTVFAAVPAHTRLDPHDVRPLLRANLLRTWVWTAATALSLGLLLLRSA